MCGDIAPRIEWWGLSVVRGSLLSVCGLPKLDDWSNISTMASVDTRQALILVGSGLIARQGFNNTGLNAVLCAAGVPKGSFYYYFSSKEEFGLAVIDNFEAEHSARLEALLTDRAFSPLQRIRNYFDAGIADMVANAFSRGCPIGNLGQELAAQNEIFRVRLDAVFNGWQGRFADCLEEARQACEIVQETDVARLAEFLLASWEGATLRAKVTHSLTPMEAFVDIFFRRVLVPPAGASAVG
ncbi:MAG: TetR/AcrR family transcriptional regulator [Acidiferrobacter sp.]